MENKTPVLFQANELYKFYSDGAVQAVNGVSLTLDKGKIYALMGSSGCGKSTLLHLIGQLDSPDHGSRLYQGVDEKNLTVNSQFRRDFFGFVFQFHHLIPVLTLTENIEAALIYQGMTASERRLKAASLLQDVGLGHRITSRANKVSGGERQRAAIARALANRPSLILADEPTGNVDSSTSAMILHQLQQYVKQNQSALLVATHDTQVGQIADVILRMKDGRITSVENLVGDDRET